MAVEIQLIQQIEKYEFLYNFNLMEYNRKDIVDDAWLKIAANMSMSVNECKEKWRNIRSSFLRSMKNTGQKTKKPYYLTEYLKFILPYLKPIANMEKTEENPIESPDNSVNNKSQLVVDFIKVEPDEYGENEENTNSNAEILLDELLSNKSNTSNCIAQKRRRLVPVNRKTEHVRNQRKFRGNPNATTNNVTKNNRALRMFLLSLLPELETMTLTQLRLFKIKTMTLIDELKSNNTEVRNNSLNTERLQKRLINLLLKNLERNID